MSRIECTGREEKGAAGAPTPPGVPDMIDLDRVSISRLALLGALQDRDPDRDVRIQVLPTHAAGYRAAQAAGFALLARIDAARDAMTRMLTHDRDLVTGDLHLRDDWEEARFALRLSCIDPAAGHALAIARAQGRTDEGVAALVEGADCAALWLDLTPEQRVSLGWQPMELDPEDDAWVDHPELVSRSCGHAA